MRIDNSSGFIGVSRIPSGWRAQISIRGRKLHLGVFKNKQLAASAYDVAFKLFHVGEFANINFPSGTENESRS
jgi:hypothetical protein